jgi:hypothetical protein
MTKAAKLTERELAESWRYQKARDQLNPAWDGEDWAALSKRQQAGFAKAEQEREQAALDFINRQHRPPGPARKSKK